MSYKIVIKGGYGLTNFGDDALMHVLSKNLQQYFKKESIAFACYDNPYNLQYANGFCIESVQNFETINTKLLLFGGGTQFYSFLPKRSKVRIILSSIKSILTSPSQYIHNRLSKKKNIGYQDIGAIGIGVGPFLSHADPNVESNAKNFFSKMSYIAVRDVFSQRKMLEWGINNSNLYADICYLMDTSKFTVSANKSIKNIGIVVRDWNQTIEGKAYYSKIESLVEKLEDKNYKVTLIIFATKSDKYWNRHKNNFSNVLEWCPEKDDIESFMNSLKEHHLLITARYHGAVFATLLNIPFISIEVEQKLQLISEVYKHSSKNWQYPFKVDECLKFVDEIDHNYIECINKNKSETMRQKSLADKMLKDFIQYCNEINLLSEEMRK